MNAGMRVHQDLLEAVEHLPEESVLELDSVSWDEYEQLLDELQERRAIRITYDCGRLDVVTTSWRHEKRNRFVDRLVYVLCDVLKLTSESGGSTTWKRKTLRKGAEADTCLYITKASAVIGKEEIDLDVDPPPDIMVEIDVSNQSDRKFPIYAAFGVPEIWRVKKGRMEFHQPQGQTYVETAASRFFPILTSDVVTEFLKKAQSEGQTAALKSFRSWVRKHLSR